MDSSGPDDVTCVVESSSSSATLGGGVAARLEPVVGTELTAGTAFGRYLVVRTLGSGGMGVVYLAYDPQLDRGVALKVLRPGARSADREPASSRLLREAQVMARLSHPNVVPVYDVGTVAAHLFVAMEHVDGRTLRQWLRDERRPWAAVLDVMVGAGRGLAAAHAAGLVHRDFKPDNVMLDAQGRPRVMDFGLARAAEDDEGPATHRDVDLELVSAGASGSGAGVESLTRTGFVLGTPAYMAPEQHFGAAPDPASDQFSFCVALHEALYGERPFEGATAADLCRAARERNVRPPPSGSGVPGWLRRAVLRGLAPTPQERWPSMDALLQELVAHRHDPSRVRAGLATIGVLAAVAGAGAWVQSGPTQDPCGGGEATLAESWNDGHREQLHEAFGRTGLAFAGEAASQTIAGLDAWGAQWVHEHRSACEATHVRHEQSGAGLDLRMHCLAGRQRALRALVEVLVSADAGTVESAGQAVEHLPRPGYCEDLEALRAEVPPPEDAEQRQRVEDLLAGLERVDALLVAARFAEARAAFDEARASVVGLDHAPAQVELGAREGPLLEAEGQLDGAVSALETALWRAEALGMDRIEASLATDLVWLDGTERNSHARGETWATLAQAKLDRLDADPRRRAALLRRRGDLADVAGKYDEAARHFGAALSLWETHDPDSLGHAHALGDFGKTHYRAGRLPQAAATFERAAAITAKVVGPWHPDVAKLRGNAATAHHLHGDYAKAREVFEDTLGLLERAYGPDHLAVATVLTNLGSVYYRLGDHAAAIEAGQRAIQIKDARLGAGNAKSGANLNNVAMALSEQGDHEQALATFRRAEAAMATLGPEHISLVEPRIGQGEELMHLGRHAEAIEPLELAYALERAQEHDARRRALPAFLLARALWDGGGERARAQVLVAEALGLLGDAPETAQDQRLVATLKAWQLEHPAAP